MLPPDVANDLFVLYLAKGVRATTAIEGNTLTEEQVRERILSSKSTLPKSQEYQGREVAVACPAGPLRDLIRRGKSMPTCSRYRR